MTDVQSCLTCPSYLGASNPDIQVRFKQRTGFPMCARYGHALGTVNSTEDELEQIAIWFGLECDSHGQPAPASPTSLSPVVANVLKEAPRSAERIRSCAQCTNQIPLDTVHPEFGFSRPMCAAKGTLIFAPIREAQRCPWAMEASGSSTSEPASVRVEIKKQYRPGFKAQNDSLLFSYVKNKGTTIEPTEYKSDLTVDPEDMAKGIRAWRVIEDPDGYGETTVAPIFDPDWEGWSEEERSLIPVTGSDSHPELYVDYAGLLHPMMVEFWLGEVVVLEGEPGVGKTQFGRWLAWLCQMPFRRVQNYKGMDVDALLGTMQIDPQRGTYFDPGVFPQAWMRPGILLDDEPNLADDAVTEVKRPMTDNSKELRIGKQVFPRNEWNIYLWAQNPAWNYLNVGTQEGADADTNRLSFLLVPEPPEVVERHIIKTYCETLDGFQISEQQLDMLINVAADMREFAGGLYPGTWGTRQQIKVARKLAHYAPEKAYRVAALNRVEPSAADSIIQTIGTHFPS